MAHILGITHPISANTAAALLVDGNLVAMAEEERFLRIKHAPFKFPLDSINYCLKSAGVRDTEVDTIAVGFSRVKNIFLTRAWQLMKSGQFRRLPDLYLRWMRWITLENKLRLLDRFPAPVYFVRHHLAHVASAFYASGFPGAIILSLDGSGGEESGMLCVGNGNQISILSSISDDHSWGMAWERITTHLGFRAHSDEGKVMGLSAYGQPDPRRLPIVDWSHVIPRIDRGKLDTYLGKVPKRDPGGIIIQEHKDLAATLQVITEKTVARIFEYAYQLTGITSFCLAGGLALNCANNGKLAQLPFVNDIFVQPASNDAGTAIGAALYIYTQQNSVKPDWQLEHLYWGPKFDEHEIEQTLKKAKISSFCRIKEISDVAKLLADGKVIGWFQGRMEFGPRALGNRSILADPRQIEMRDTVNIIKGREIWRPLAPSILEEHIEKFVIGKIGQPYYMVLAYRASKRALKEIPATVHVDETLRPQAVQKRHSKRYWELISAFHKLTGVPAILNTSFNLAGEPIVMTPQDALGTFFRSGIDKLVLGNFLVWK